MLLETKKPSPNNPQVESAVRSFSEAIESLKKNDNVTTNEAPPVAEAFFSPEEPIVASPIDDGVSVASIQTAGVLIDADGGVWTVPEEDAYSDDLKLYQSPFDIKKDERFYYQFENYKDANILMSEGFRPVSRKELGLDGFKALNIKPNEYGIGADGTYTVGDLVCMKIPKVIEQRKRAAMKRLCDSAVEATDKKFDEHGRARPGATYIPESLAAKGNEALSKIRATKGGNVSLNRTTVSATPRKPDNEMVHGQTTE
jgi:hypothetical protein